MSNEVAGLKTGDKLGKATVYVDIVSKGNLEIRPQTKMTPKYITIHNTGNSGKGANAKAHNTLIHNMAGKNPRDTSHVSWHVAIDENNIYIHIPFNERAWHCGDGANGTGNTSSIGLEICMHSDQKNYMQAEENAIALTVHLMNYYKISSSNVQPHMRWSGKNCPQVILKRDSGFEKFRARVESTYQLSKKATTSPTPSTSTNTKKEDKIVLTEAERKSAKDIIKLACQQKVFDAKVHTEAKINSYTDSQLASYMIIYITRKINK